MKKRLSDSEFWSALTEASGLFSQAAKLIRVRHEMNYSRQAVAERANRHPEKLQGIVEENLDFAESMLIKLMNSKSERIQEKAVEFYLRTKGRNRDYVERSENSVLIKKSEILTKEEILEEIERIEAILNNSKKHPQKAQISQKSGGCS